MKIVYCVLKVPI